MPDLVNIGAAANDGKGDVLRSAFSKFNQAFADISFNVKTYGAKGDGATDDCAAIQAAINAAQLAGGGVVFFPHPSASYRINSPLIITGLFVTLDGGSAGTTIYNHGIGPAIQINAASYIQIKNLAVWGLGGAYGAGATDTYGIELIGANYIVFDNVSARYHGSHGIYNHGGGNSIELYRCDARHNFGNGLHSISPSGLEQNGNALMIYGGGFNLNSGHGIAWSATGLGLFGVRLEANIGAGVSIDSSTATLTSKNATISGCYFEANRAAQIAIRAGAGFYGGSIRGNYLRWSAGATSTESALIVGSGAGSIQLLEVGANAYLSSDAQVSLWVNLGGRPTSSCFVDTLDNPQNYSGLGSSKTPAYFSSTDIDSSAKLRAILTDETGTGSLVFSTNPQFGASIGIGVAASGTSSTPIYTLSNSNGSVGPKFENANTGTSAACASFWYAGNLGLYGSIQFAPANYTLTNIAGRLLSTVSSTANGITEFLTGAQTWDVQVDNATVLKADANAGAGNTRLLLWDVTAGSLKRVSIGAADSGGSGFKLLRIPN